MKFTASILTVFAASILLLQSCGSDTTGDRAELATVLDEAADREGVPPSECRDECVRAALAVFDACTDDGGDREACFGRAIHSFFECVKECPPPTCEQVCEAKARQHQMQCLDEGGTVDGCNREAREVLARCNEGACADPEPPACKEECESHAQEVYDRCIEGGTGGTGGFGPTPKTGAGGSGGDDGEEKQCRALAREAYAECAKACEEPEPPTCEEGCKLAATAVLEECLDGLEAGADEAECAVLAREAYAECLVENDCIDPEPPTCEDACGAVATHVYEACMSKLDSEERCGEIARAIQRLCNKHCEGYECPCHDDCDDEDSDDSGKDCDPDGPTPKSGGHCK
jgi:hypothetical protein